MALEVEKSQLQNQISNLNNSVIAMKAELEHSSDDVLEKEKTLREKEQVINELGGVVKSLQNTIVCLFCRHHR